MPAVSQKLEPLKLITTFLLLSVRFIKKITKKSVLFLPKLVSNILLIILPKTESFATSFTRDKPFKIKKYFLIFF